MNGPDYPSPAATAGAQSQANLSTSMAQQLLNMVNQRGPYGSLSYRPSGTYTYTDPLTHKQVTIPQFTARTKLTPAQQQLLNQQQRFGHMTNSIGINQAGRIGEMLGQPINLNNEATEARLMQLGQARMDPIWNQREAALKQQLQNRGVAEGSEAWKNAFNTFSNSRNDAYNQLLLTGRQQAVNEALTSRNQPINETTALMSGGQVSQPQFVNTPNTNVQGTDYMGAVNNKFNAQNQQYMGMMGGLFGLGSAGLGGWAMSDRRAKKNIKKVGNLKDGTPVHKFQYKKKFGGGLMQLGVMAQDAEKKHPKAVAKTASGMKAVNYSRLAQEAAAV